MGTGHGQHEYEFVTAAGTVFLDPPAPNELAGSVIIAWPKRREGILPGFAEATVTDVATGRPIITQFDLAVHASAEDQAFIAEMTMLCDEDGNPVVFKTGREVLAARYDADGRILMRRFRWLVTEMKAWQ